MILSFLLVSGAADQADAWTQLSSSQRSSLKAGYKSSGISLLVSAFGSTDSPTTDGKDPTALAESMANWVKTWGMDGIDVDYEVRCVLSIPSLIRGNNSAPGFQSSLIRNSGRMARDVHHCPPEQLASWPIRDYACTCVPSVFPFSFRFNVAHLRSSSSSHSRRTMARPRPALQATRHFGRPPDRLVQRAVLLAGDGIHDVSNAYLVLWWRLPRDICA